MKFKETLEKIAEKSVSFLDRKYYHLSNQDLNPNVTLSSESDFDRLERERIPYCLQGLAGGLGALSSLVLSLTSAAQGMVCVARWLGYGVEGDEVLANKQYIDAVAMLGIGIASAYASPLFLKFGEKTMQRFEVLKKKTDDYALAHGLSTATANNSR